MNRKKLMAFLITGVMLFSANNVIAAQNNSTNTLDIEKAAMETISNSQKVKTYDEQTKNAEKKYLDAQNAAKSVLSSGKGDLVQTVIFNPVNAENTLNQFLTNKDVNTNSVRIDAYSSYIDLLKASYAVNIQKELTDSLEQDNKKAKLQLDNGLISKNDARLIEINYLKAVYNLNNLKRSLDSAYMSVNLDTGTDISKQYETLTDTNIVPASQIKPLADYVKSALASRGEIVNAQNALNANKRQFEYAKSTRYPDYEFYVQKTQWNIDNAQNSLDQAKVKIELEINDSYDKLQGYMKAMESQQANYDLAESEYNSAKIKYDNSMITLNDLENAQIAKAKAQINLKNAQLDAWLSQTKMSYATGIGYVVN